jgi:hypothetical protein
MHRMILSGAVIVLLAGGRAEGGLIVNTTPGWSVFGGSGASDLGGDYFFGQTFRLTGSNLSLDSFSMFAVNLDKQGGNINFALFVMQWDGAKAVGPVLYQSSMVSTTLPASFGGNRIFEGFTFNTGALSLTSGQAYVAILGSPQFAGGYGGGIDRLPKLRSQRGWRFVYRGIGVCPIKRSCTIGFVIESLVSVLPI